LITYHPKTRGLTFLGFGRLQEIHLGRGM